MAAPAQVPPTELARTFSQEFRSRFEILSTLGAGGMGVVFLGRQIALDRRVAIKFTHAQDPEIRARFAREGRVMARLQHPNVIQVYEAGEDGGRPFLVCEVVDGQSLAAMLASQGTLALGTALDLGRQIASALAYTHGQGVLHRDLKCDNVLLTADGTAKVCDFGLSRAATGLDRMTQTGAVMGTPEYMAPEVVKGQEATPRTDLYSLGCMLVEMLTGSVPFPAMLSDGSRRSIVEVMHAHLHEPIVAPSSRRRGLPAALDTLIVQCLAKDPADRPVSAAAVEAALSELNGRTPGSAVKRAPPVTGVPGPTSSAASRSAATQPRGGPLRNSVASRSSAVPSAPVEGCADGGATRSSSRIVRASRSVAAATPAPVRAGPGRLRGAGACAGGLLLVVGLVTFGVVDRAPPPAAPAASSAEVVRAGATANAAPDRPLANAGVKPARHPAVRLPPDLRKLGRHQERLAPEKAAIGLALAAINEKTYVEYENPADGSLLIYVPPDSFDRGSEDGEPDEAPVRRLTMPGFFIGKTEVTWAQYLEYCRQSGAPLPPTPSWRSDGTHPVVNVNWDEANAY